MIKLKELLKEGKFGTIYKMKDEMNDGTFDPKNPQVHIHGLGVYYLKTLEKRISKDLAELSSDVKHGGAERVEKTLYRKYSPLEAKIKAAAEAKDQMNSSQYKRAVTMYRRKK